MRSCFFAVLMTCALMSQSANANTSVLTYSYAGPMAQTFIVPAAVTSIDFDVWGAQGSSTTFAGGLGAHVSGAISVFSGEVLQIYVGGSGSFSGFNSGGTGNSGLNGGGASDIRSGSNRLVVAGGGGSAGYAGQGGGAGLIGQAGTGGGFGGGATQNSGGSSGGYGAGSGAFGAGGSAVYGAGGGGGYFGGGASASVSAGGGGGSSFFGSRVTEGLVGTSGRSGNGFVTLSWVTTPVPEPETYGMLLAGLGIICAAIRGRKSK